MIAAKSMPGIVRALLRHTPRSANREAGVIARLRLLPSRLKAAAASHPNEVIVPLAFGFSTHLFSWHVDHSLVLNNPEPWEKSAAGVISELKRVFEAGEGDPARSVALSGCSAGSEDSDASPVRIEAAHA